MKSSVVSDRSRATPTNSRSNSLTRATDKITMGISDDELLDMTKTRRSSKNRHDGK